MDKKSEQLGMPFGTACGRLERKVLFQLVQQAKRDICCRCGNTIERVNDLSMDHKRPWQDVDPLLFWDLENIAFSHKRCNYAAGARGKPRKNDKTLNAPPGRAWCAKHKDYVSIGDFHKDKNTKNGLERWCKGCCKASGFKGSYGH